MLQQIKFIQEETIFKNYITQRLFTANSFLRDKQFFSCKSEHIKIPCHSCSDKSNDSTDIPLSNSGLNRINHCNNNLIDEPIENFICSDLDVIEKPKESLSDNITVTSLIVTLISSKILMTATEIEMMIAMKILLYQIISDQPILNHN